MQKLALRLSVLLLFALPAHAQQIPDQGWPRTLTRPGATLTLYQPQIDDWKDFTQVDARIAFSLTPTGGQSHVGVIALSMQSTVNVAAHSVYLNQIHIKSVVFPSLDAPTAAKLKQLMTAFLNPSAYMTISLDRLVATVTKPKAPAASNLRNDPPAIFVSLGPAILLLVNGPPVLSPLADSDFQFIVNANWPVFTDKAATKYYLFNGRGWMTAAALAGPWIPTKTLPKHFEKVAVNSNFTSLKTFIPPPPGSAATFPAVYYSADQAEIIVFDGAPKWLPIAGTQLSYAGNTDSTIFKYAPTGALYFLASGRWFSAATTLGPWTYATENLPADFANIPPNSPAGKVLASVPGTPEAEDAVLIAQIPTTATVDMSAAAKSVQVTYVGAPQFMPITGTTMYYAVNTPNRIIQVGAQYYLCYQGVWFVSGNPNAGWIVAVTVPSVIYTIPPSSPIYNVTYVTQVVVTPGYVTSSYTAGYMGAFILGATVGAIVANGTGYYYPPYVYRGYYYPCAWTYGYHTYNPYTGAYGHGGSAYGPYGSAHWQSSYNPNTGTYARGATYSNANGSHTVGQAYNPYTGAYAQTNQHSNAYGSWGNSAISKNGNTVYTQHQSNANGTAASFNSTTGAKGAGVSTANGKTGAAKTANGDMYAGHDGNVYKNTGDGWQKYDNGSWTPVQPPDRNSNGNQPLNSSNNNSNRPTTNNNTATTNQQKAQNYNQQRTTTGATNGAATNNAARNNSASNGSWSGANNGGWNGNSNANRSSASAPSDLNQQAQDRARGNEQSNRFSQDQQRSNSSDRSGGWGGDRSSGGWGGGNRSGGSRGGGRR